MYACITGKTNIDNTKWVCLTYTLRNARKTFLLRFIMYRSEKASNDSLQVYNMQKLSIRGNEIW